MHILVVDDEELALAELTHELKIVFPNAALHGYRNPKEAIERRCFIGGRRGVFLCVFRYKNARNERIGACKTA